MKLFRQEVIDAKRENRLGTLRMEPPRFGWLVTGISSLLIVTLAGLCVFGKYARYERVDGRLVPDGGQVEVQSPSSGIVRKLLVKTGQVVKEGDPLVVVTNRRTGATTVDAEAIVAEQLQEKRRSISASILDQAKLLQARRSELLGRVKLLGRQTSELAAQIQIQGERTRAAAQIYKKWSTDGREVISAVQIAQQHDVVLQNESRLSELRLQSARILQERNQALADLSELPSEVGDKTTQLKLQLADVSSALAENNVAAEQVLRAPVSGIVTSISVSQGQPTAANISLVALRPEGSDLIAELWVPSRSMANLTSGSTARIRYAAFPYQQFGAFHGHITEVEKSPAQPALVSKLLGGEIKEPRYRVVVALDRQYVTTSDRREYLKPGMSLSADVLLERRTIMRWIFRPVTHQENQGRG